MRKCLMFLVLVIMVVLFGTDTELWSDEKKTGSPKNGKLLYDKLKCSYCHNINGQGGNVGPDLTKIGAKNKGIEWQIKNLVDPATTHPRHPDSHMPKFDRMTDKMLLDLASYLESLK